MSEGTDDCELKNNNKCLFYTRGRQNTMDTYSRYRLKMETTIRYSRERVSTAYRIHRITELNIHEFVYHYRDVHNNDYALNVNDDR